MNPGDPIGPNQIVSSNGVGLSAFVRAQGGEPINLGIAPDDAEALKIMAQGAAGADMLVTIGGASVGDHDLIQKVLGEVGLKVEFWKIAMKPGKPLTFALVPRTGGAAGGATGAAGASAPPSPLPDARAGALSKTDSPARHAAYDVTRGARRDAWRTM